MSDNTRSPPASKDAERSVLGSMLRDNPVIADVLQIVNAENFYYAAHQTIFRAVVAIYDKGHPVDLVILADWLKDKKQIEDIGGYGYLSELWDAAPTAANAEHYARIVRGHSVRRSLLLAGNEILRDSYDSVAPADELVEAAEKKIMAIAQHGIIGVTLDMQRCVSDAYNRIDARVTRANDLGLQISGLPTGFPDLDALLCGLQKSELIIIAARPSVGKTAIALNIARHTAVDCGTPLLFVSLEQSHSELAERLMCSQGRVNGHAVRKGMIGRDEHERLQEAGEQLRKAPMFIDDTSNQSVLRIASNARRHKLRQGIELVIVDYLQLVDPDDSRLPRHEQVASMSRRFKHLARELQLPIVVLCQLNRVSEERADGRPRLHDLRESGGLEQDADAVLLLHRPKLKGENGNEETSNLVEVVVAKQRNGPIGQATLFFHKEYARFDNYDPGPRPFAASYRQECAV